MNRLMSEPGWSTSWSLHGGMRLGRAIKDKSWRMIPLILLLGCGGGFQVVGPKADIEEDTARFVFDAVVGECETIGFPEGCADRMQGRSLTIEYDPSYPGLFGQFKPSSRILLFHHRASSRTLGHELVHWMMWHERRDLYDLDHEPKEWFDQGEEIGAEFIRWDTWCKEFYGDRCEDP
ncbi:hypothetical protein ACFL3Q_12385 [Planctomycetota bacterium]